MTAEASWDRTGEIVKAYVQVIDSPFVNKYYDVSGTGFLVKFKVESSRVVCDGMVKHYLMPNRYRIDSLYESEIAEVVDK